MKVMANKIILTDSEFHIFQKLIYRDSGIDLGESKKILVESRLMSRVLFFKLKSFTEYLRLVQINAPEKAQMINLITTNETYFFREPQHFDFLKNTILPENRFNRPLRLWSAASSVGAEAYSIAMVLDSHIGSSGWEIIGTDINTDVLQKARIGLYPEVWTEKIPQEYKKRYCLHGKGAQEGKFLVDRNLLENIRFEQANLLIPQPALGTFDVVFLRNILFYFDTLTKQRVIDNILNSLRNDGYLLISHTENLNMIECQNLVKIQASIYKKRAHR